MGAERNSGDITRTQAKPPTPSALHPRHDHPGFGTSLAPASEKANGSMRPRYLRAMRPNEQCPDADVCSFVRSHRPCPHKAPTRGLLVRSQRACRRPTNPTPQHYPRQRLARIIAPRTLLTGMWQEKHKSLLGCWLALLAPAYGSPWDADVQDSLMSLAQTPPNGL